MVWKDHTLFLPGRLCQQLHEVTNSKWEVALEPKSLSSDLDLCLQSCLQCLSALSHLVCPLETNFRNYCLGVSLLL